MASPLLSANRWTLRNLGRKVVWWFDPKLPATYELTSGAVSALADLSTYRYRATQGTSANRPTIGVTSQGLPALVFDGVNDYLQIASIAAVAQPLMFLFAMDAYAGGTGNADMVRENATGGPAVYRNLGGTIWSMYAGNYMDDGGALYTTGLALRTALFNGASSIQTNAGNEVGGDAGTTGITSDAYNLGAGFGASSLAAVKISEMALIYAPTVEEQAKAIGYMAWNNRLRHLMPAGHRYRNRAP